MKISERNRKDPSCIEIILSSPGPPRNRNSASLLKCFGEFLKLSPVAVPEKQSPFLVRTMIFPLCVPFPSQSVMTSFKCRPQPACLPSYGAVYQQHWCNIHFWVENKLHIVHVCFPKLGKYLFSCGSCEVRIKLSAVYNSTNITFTFFYSLPQFFFPFLITAAAFVCFPGMGRNFLNLLQSLFRKMSVANNFFLIIF